MIDEEKRQSLVTGLKTGKDRALEVLAGLDADMITTLKETLDELLPNKSLKDVNLEHELMEQFEKVKQLQRDVALATEVPANQRAQVANAVATTLQQLIKMQTEFNTSERFKAIEALMVKAMKTLPKDVAEKFLADYERIEA